MCSPEFQSISVYDNPTTQQREVRFEDGELWGFFSARMIHEKEIIPYGRARGWTKSFTFFLAIPWGLFDPKISFPPAGAKW